jgi:hypothetical protein
MDYSWKATMVYSYGQTQTHMLIINKLTAMDYCIPMEQGRVREEALSCYYGQARASRSLPLFLLAPHKLILSDPLRLRRYH